MEKNILPQLEEIIASQPFIDNLLGEGEERIIDVRDSGNLDVQIKGTFASGVEDEITRADKEVRDHYLEAVRENYPNWSIVMEDNEDSTDFSRIPEEGIVAFFDPLDGTKLLKEGKKGYSTMAAVGLKVNGQVRPILGSIRIVGDHTSLSAADSRFISGNRPKTNLGRAYTPILGRTSIERAEPKILSPLTEKLGYETKMIRGIGPNVRSLITGETGVCIYEPGVSFWDIFPAMPIVYGWDGEVFGLDGKEIVYDGKSNQIQNGAIMLMNPKDKSRILEISQPLLDNYLNAKK